MLESVTKYCSEITIKHRMLIVSVGAGRAETEMNSNYLCICAFAWKYRKKVSYRFWTIQYEGWKHHQTVEVN